MPSWIEHIFVVVYKRINIEQTLEKPEGAIKSRQSRNTGNIGRTRHKIKTNKTNKHNTTQKTRKMSNTQFNTKTELNTDDREG